MSADNYVLIRRLTGGFYWGNLSASRHWGLGRVPDSALKHGPFPSEEAASEDAERELPVIEYGIEIDD